MISLVLACVSEPDTGLATGALSMRFEMDSGYRESMEEPAVGRFHGSIWRGSEVTALGPRTGAEKLRDVVLEELDLSGDGPTAVLATTQDLPAIEVAVLGFMDSDDNADPEESNPDAKDPVTLPADNFFVVIPDETTEITVFIGFLYP